MKLFINVVLLIITLSFVNLAQTQDTVKTEPDVQVENGKLLGLTNEDLIREIIFREILKPHCLNPSKSLKVYYLSIDGGKNPSENLLKELSDCKVTIKKVSESVISANDDKFFSNELPQKQDVLFSISKLEWKSKDEVKVSATSGTGNLGTNGCTYILKSEKSKWKIVSIEDCFVS